MKEKKHSANWYIAATHYLTAGFAIPLVVNFIGLIILDIIIPQGSILNLFIILLNVVAVWLGVKYSAGYLRKKYIISDKDKIANLATTYLVVLVTIYFIVQLSTGKIEGINILVEIIRMVAISIIFFISSKKYIANTADVVQKFDISQQ